MTPFKRPGITKPLDHTISLVRRIGSVFGLLVQHLDSIQPQAFGAETLAFSLDQEPRKDYSVLVEKLRKLGIQAQETSKGPLPPEAMMHDLGAPIPDLVISPRSEWGVAQVLKTFKDLGLYDDRFLSIILQ